MIISELNHLQVIEQETSVIGARGKKGNKTYGGGSEINVDIDKDVYVDVYENVYIDKYFDVYSDVWGVSAFAEAEALAYGKNAHAESLTFTYSQPGFATSSAQSNSLS